MKTSMILIVAALAGSTAFAGGRTGYDASGTSTQTQHDSNSNYMPKNERAESAYDSAMKPDRTMRHNTFQSRASNEYNQDVDRSSWDRDGYRSDQTPGTRE